VIIKRVELACDGCEAVTEARFPSAKAAVGAMRLDGWYVKGHRVFCPDCKKERGIRHSTEDCRTCFRVRRCLSAGVPIDGRSWVRCPKWVGGSDTNG